MQYNRKDIIDYMGQSKGLSHIIKLRKVNLGKPLMTRNISTNPHTKEPTVQMVAMFHFNPDEVINYFKNHIKEYIEDPFKHARPLYIEAWNDAIRVAEHFKNKEF